MDKRRVWKRTFWQVYDNIGLLFIVTTLWVLFSLTVIFLPSATAALFYIAYLIIQDKPARISGFFKNIYRLFLKSTLLIIIFLGLCSLLILNIKFYIKNAGFLGFILAGINFWMLLFAGLSLIYLFPLITRGKTIFDTLKYSFLLTLINFKANLITAVIVIIFLVLEIIIPVIGMGILAVFLQNIFLETEAGYSHEITIESPKRKLKELWQMQK